MIAIILPFVLALALVSRLVSAWMIPGQIPSDLSWEAGALKGHLERIAGGGWAMQPQFLITGALLVIAATALRRWWPSSPFHPVGLVAAFCVPVWQCWFGLALGWLAKVVTLRWGGMGLYQSLRPAAMGLIVASIVFGFSLGIFFTVAMIAFAACYILYDTSKILHHYRTDQYVAASLGLFASVSAQLWAGPRVLAAMGRSTPALAFLTPKSGPPGIALIIQSTLALAFVFLSTFRDLVNYTQTGLTLCTMLTVAGVFFLRKKLSTSEFRRLLVPALIFLAMTAFAIVRSIVAEPLPTLAGLATAFACTLLWFALQPSKS